ncbi:MAG: hypothetical protein AB7T06_06655 [Kofleriaceae bacterium]
MGFIDRSWRAGIGIAIAVALLLLIGTRLPQVAEDAYISFRYAANLVDRGELVFNAGERVEAYTNLSWTLMLAGAYSLGISLESASRWIGVGFAIASIVYVYRFALLFDARRAPVAPVVLGVMTYHAIWSWLGLEPSAFGFFLLAVAYYLHNRNKAPSYGAAAVCAVLAYSFRPEGGLAMLAVGTIVFVRRAPLRWQVAAFLLATLLGHLAFRLAYYGDILPNTFHAKAHVSIESVGYGARYVADLAVFGGGAILIALGIACRSDAVGTDTDRAMSAVVLIYLVYLVLVGGDYMGASRFGAPVLPLVSVWMFRAGLVLWDRDRAAKVGVVIAFVVHTALGAYALHRELATTEDGFISRIGFLQRYVHDRLLVGRWLEQNVDGPRTVTGSAMGVLPWHLREAQVVDARGITDRTVATTAPIVSGRPGHARFASDAYLLSRHPEVLLHRYGIGPEPELRYAPAGYHPVCVSIAGMDEGNWFCFAKRDDVSLGIGTPPEGMFLAIVGEDGRVIWRAK